MAKPTKAPKTLHLHGTKGSDHLLGGDGNDVIHGHNGSDLLEGGAGDDRLFGGDGNDNLFGERLGEAGATGNDVLHGGDGNDTLLGGAGTNYLYGDAGNDSFHSIPAFDSGFNYIDGGEGVDGYSLGFGSFVIAKADGTVSVSTGGDPRQSLDGVTFHASVTNVENWYSPLGNPGDAGQYIDLHTLTHDLRIFGVSGGTFGEAHDTLIGGSGNDFFYGGGGSDFIDGGQGTDTAYFNGTAGGHVFGYNEQGQFTDGFSILVSIELVQFDDGSTYTPAELVILSQQHQSAFMV